MIKKISCSFVASCVGLISFATNTIPGPINLDLKTTKGSKVGYVFVENTNSSISMMGQDMNMGSSSTVEYTLESKPDSAGLHGFIAVLKSTVKEMEQMGQKMNINTLDPKADTTSETIGSMIKFYKNISGKPYSIYVGKTGKIETTSGAKEIYKNAIAKLDLSGPMAAMKSMAGESILTADLEKLFNFFPCKPVEIGNKWELKATSTFNGIPLNTVNTYKLLSIEGNKATISSSSIINFDGDMEAIPGASAKAMGTLTGKIVVNIDNGQMISTVGEIDLEIKLNAQGMDIPMKSSGKYSITAK